MNLLFYKKQIKAYCFWVQKLLYSSNVLFSSYITKQNDLFFNIHPASLRFVCLFLKKHTNCQYSVFTDLCCVDYIGKKKRFELIYQLLSIQFCHRIFVKIQISEDFSQVESLTSVYPASNWYEREVFDLFGIFFKHHPSLRRILTDYGFEGFPIRKDFPLGGFSEVFFDFEKKRVVCVPVEFSQNFRVFSFISNKNKKKFNQNFFSSLFCFLSYG